MFDDNNHEFKILYLGYNVIKLKCYNVIML